MEITARRSLEHPQVKFGNYCQQVVEDIGLDTLIVGPNLITVWRHTVRQAIRVQSVVYAWPERSCFDGCQDGYANKPQHKLEMYQRWLKSTVNQTHLIDLIGGIVTIDLLLFLLNNSRQYTESWQIDPASAGRRTW